MGADAERGLVAPLLLSASQKDASAAAAPERLSARKASYLEGLRDVPESDNPFFNRTHGRQTSASLTRRLTSVLLLPLAILRVALTVLNVAMAFFILKLATCGLGKEDYHPVTGKPLSRIRQLLCAPVFLHARFQLLLLGFWRIRVKGKCASQAEAPVIVSNHVSGLVEGMYFLRCAKLAEMSYVRNPVLAPFMLATMSILVDRADPNSRDHAKKALLRRSQEPLWPQTIVFPEGTCTNGTAMVQFKQGAFLPGCPVQPVILRYSYTDHDPSFTFPHSSGSYLWGLFTQLANHMEVEYLDVYVPGEEEKKSPSLFAANVQRVMAQALQVQTTKHAAEDVALCIAAQRYGLPVETGVVHWEAVTESLVNFRVRDAMDTLKAFADIDGSQTGRVDYPTFAAAMRQKAHKKRRSTVQSSSAAWNRTFSTPQPAASWLSSSRASRKSSEAAEADMEAELTDSELRSIFDLLDAAGDGFVDFREYLCGVAILNGQGQNELRDILSMTFDCLDQDQSKITKAQLDKVLLRADPRMNPGRLEELFLEADQDRDGLVSRRACERDEFINFFLQHRDDLPLHAAKQFPGLRGLK